MLLKRYYNFPSGWAPQRNTRDPETGKLADPTKAANALLNPPPIRALSIIHTGVQETQRFSRNLVDSLVEQGHLTLRQGKILLHAQEETLTYTILRMPGTYCCHCQAKLDQDSSGQLSRQHVAEAHAGIASPDSSHPAGYEVLNAYECVLASEQHTRWQRPADATVSHRRRNSPLPPASGVQEGNSNG